MTHAKVVQCLGSCGSVQICPCPQTRLAWIVCWNLSALLGLPRCQGRNQFPQLSPHAVAGLHGVARCVGAGSSTQGLEVHACGSCSSVSGASSFTPVLTAVLTTARQLQG